MYPTYRSGDRLLINLDAYLTETPVPEDIVLAKHPFKTGIFMIKRVSHITDNQHYFVVGDNLVESSDSRGFGALRLDKILGKVIKP